MDGFLAEKNAELEIYIIVQLTYPYILIEPEVGPHEACRARRTPMQRITPKVMMKVLTATAPCRQVREVCGGV